MTKKICHVFYDEFPKDSRVRRYVNAGKEAGFDSFIVCSKGNSPRWFERDSKGSRIYRIPVSKKRSSFARRMYEYGAFFILAGLVVTYITLRHRVRVFQVHTLPDFLVFSCLLPKLLGGRIILDFHELFPEFMMQHKPRLTWDSAPVRLLAFQEKLSFRFADEVLIFSHPARDILERRCGHPDKIRVIMNGVDESELPVIDRKKTSQFRIVYNGTISFNLNLSLIVEALAIIKSENRCLYDTIVFCLYGDGPDLPVIMETAGRLGVDNVQYLGRYEFSEMMKELASASVCVLPPRRDIYSDLYYSLKLTEMIYFRIPVIATRLNTYMHYYPEGCLAYFNSGDARELAREISRLASDPDSAVSITRRAFDEYQKYSWPVMKKQYIDHINSHDDDR